MKQTPSHDIHNPDLLRFIPLTARRIAEVGCSAGALAREFKQLAPACDYLGIDIDAGYTELARRYCDRAVCLDIERADESFWRAAADRDCWIFGDSLEHLTDPWDVLRKVRAKLAPEGCVVACIPNSQHWSMLARLSVGELQYEDSGLLDRTHLRFFTRKTILQMFEQTGFKITEGMPRIFNEPPRDQFLPLIEQMARLLGGDTKQAVSDAMALQYVVRAVPA